MLLTATAHKIELVTDAAVDVDVYAAYHKNTDPVSHGHKGTKITTAATTDISGSPGSGEAWLIDFMAIRNIHASATVVVTVRFNDGTNNFQLHKETLLAGEALEYVHGMGFFPVRALGSPRTEYVKLAGDVGPSSSTTLADVTGAVFPVLSGQYYRFRFLVLHQSAATTTGIRLTVAIPSATAFAGAARLPVSTAADGTANIFKGHITSSDDVVIGTGTPAAATTHLAIVHGVLVPSANGNLQLRYASEVAASNVTIKQGTLGLLERWP